VYPNGKTIAFVGTHNGVQANPLNGGALEPNGTMIIDVTDPKNPKETAHIPVPVQGGQAQMARMCLGSELPGGVPGHVYLLTNNLEVDNRGFIHATDRNGFGLDILQRQGQAKKIGLG
jgi:hypothetical protein